MTENKVENLEVKATFQKVGKGTGTQVYLSWEVTSRCVNPITIIGYRLYFQSQHKETPKPEKFISNSHIVTQLWEDEKRFYRWKKVNPSYYGIDLDGVYHYELQIAYSIKGDIENKVTDWIKSNKQSLTPDYEEDLPHQEALVLLSKVFPNYLQSNYAWDEKPKCVMEARIGDTYMTDLLCYTKTGKVAVIEYKAKIGDIASLLQLNHYLGIAEQIYSSGSENTFGFLVAPRFSRRVEDEIEKFPRIHIIKIGDLAK